MNFEPIPIPTYRNVPVDSWRPPAGVRMISADDHQLEMENLWEERLPAQWKPKAPRFYQDKAGWHMEAEGRELLTPGLVTQISESVPGYMSRTARLKVMDGEGIDVSVLFPGRLQTLNALQDKDLYIACMDVYNEWLAEHLKPHGRRLIGVPMLCAYLRPEATRDMIQKIKDLGFKTMQMPSFPRDIRYNSRSFDPMWAEIAASGIPLSFHVGNNNQFQGYGSLGANLGNILSPFRALFGQLVFAGIFERHPGLKVVFTEGGASWAATALSDMDYLCKTYYDRLNPKLQNLPSFYWQRQCYTTFMYDPVALELVDRIGADNMLWSTDFPHSEGTMGRTGEIARSIWETVGPDKARKILGGNAARLWGL